MQFSCKGNADLIQVAGINVTPCLISYQCDGHFLAPSPAADRCQGEMTQLGNEANIGE